MAQYSIIETALYKLALNNTISLNEAKALKALYLKRACSLGTLSCEFGLSRHESLAALNSLQRRGIINERGGIYYCENFAQKLFALINDCESVSAYTAMQGEVHARS